MTKRQECKLIIILSKMMICVIRHFPLLSAHVNFLLFWPFTSFKTSLLSASIYFVLASVIMKCLLAHKYEQWNIEVLELETEIANARSELKEL